MTVRILILLGLSALLLAGEEAPKQKTEHFDFPSGGTLRLTHSTGVLTVEGWDRPEVEVTTQVHVEAKRNGDELVINMDSPQRLEYRVKAPIAARLIVNHRVGEVSVDGLTGDIEVTLGRGDI